MPLCIVRVVRVHFGLEPLDFESMVTTFKTLLSHCSNSIARVPGVDLIDHVTHHKVGFGGHRDFVVFVEGHVEPGEHLDLLLVVPDKVDGEAALYNLVKCFHHRNNPENPVHVVIAAQLLDCEPHLKDYSEKLPGMIAFKAVGALIFSSVDIIFLQELVDEGGALVSLLVVRKRLLNLVHQFSRDASHCVKARNISDRGHLDMVSMGEEGLVDSILEVFCVTPGPASGIEPRTIKKKLASK